MVGPHLPFLGQKLTVVIPGTMIGVIILPMVNRMDLKESMESKGEIVVADHLIGSKLEMHNKNQTGTCIIPEET
jgi:hypothetical protein